MDDANPFACFSFDDTPSDGVGVASAGTAAVVPTVAWVDPRLKPDAACKRPRTAVGPAAAAEQRQKSDAGLAFMLEWWKELRGLAASDYPFAVMITGVLGAQARDIVSVAALRRLAAHVDNDLSPQNLSRLDIDSLEDKIRTVNHCRKKSKTIIDLAKIILRKSMPSTRIGLCQLPGMV
jgi:endonuclease III